ncbi:hypothetical protein P5008_08650 [Helcococcus ovis]|uniref:DUF6895 family protein n=1 Tax=Helcococcus ovis TaxID=72026 RepID=UPI003916FDF1
MCCTCYDKLSIKNSEFYIKINKLIDNKIKSYSWDDLLIRNSSLFPALIYIDSFNIDMHKKSVFDESLPSFFSYLNLRAPYRMLEIYTYIYLYYKSKSNNNIEEILKKTILGKKKNINLLNYMDIYSITHELFYIHLLIKNNNLISIYFDKEKKFIKSYLLGIITFINLEGHFDLLIELILCLALFDFKFSYDEIFVIEKSLENILQNTKKSGGIIPHKKYNKKIDIDFFDLYHTTSVAKGMVDAWKKKL